MWLTEFLGIGSQIKTLNERKEEIKKRLSGLVEEQGTEDDKGHVWLELDAPVEGVSALKRERRGGQEAD